MHALRLLTGTGEDLRLDSVRPGVRGEQPASPILRNLSTITRSGLATIRTEFGRFGRQVSGYSLEHLLPENGFDVTRLLVGSEGTLGVCTEATVRLVREPAHRMLVVLGFGDIAAAGDAAPLILTHRPTACEGIDSRIVDVVRARKGDDAVPPLPAGGAWLFVEVVGESRVDALDKAERFGSDCGAVSSLVVEDDTQARALWRIREDGAGLAGRSPAGRPAHAGWEDAAVPPCRRDGWASTSAILTR